MLTCAPSVGHQFSVAVAMGHRVCLFARVAVESCSKVHMIAVACSKLANPAQVWTCVVAAHFVSGVLRACGEVSNNRS